MQAVTPPHGVRLEPLEVGLVGADGYRDGADRHGRMFRDHEFDVCEQSLASYIMARSRGDDSLIGAPVFPRRLFSQSCIFVSARSSIRHPHDLNGRQVAINSFQTTLCVLAKGDLKFEYNVPWESIHWCLLREEELAWDADDSLSIRSLPPDSDVVNMLVKGELDAYIHPSPPMALYDERDRIQRLFPDWRGESVRYFNNNGYCPIMHIMVFPREVVERDDWLPMATIDMWEQAKQKTIEYYSDPGYSLLLFARHELESQQAELQFDPWPSGLAANRKNLQQFIHYMVDQRLIESAIDVDDLFHPSTHNT